MNPATRLNPENTISVSSAGAWRLSAMYPVRTAIAPIKITKATYRPVVALVLNVHLALTKKLNVTATENATRFDIAWFKPNKLNSTPKHAQ